MRIEPADLAEAAALWVLRLLPPDELPVVAANALEAGLDSPCLRRLAGESDGQQANCAPLFQHALQELGVSMPGPPAARLVVSRRLAAMMLAGQVAPYPGARELWSLATDASDSGDEHTWNLLSGFANLADDWEDLPDRRPELEAEILEDARALLQQGAA